MRKVLVFYFLGLSMLLLFSDCTKKEDKVLATVGETKITIGDFDAWFQISPVKRTPEELWAEKRRFLDDLIEKRLLYLEGVRRGYDKDSLMVNELKLEELKKRVMCQIFLEREVIEKAKVSKKEIRDYYRKIGEQVRARHIVVASEEEAKEILSKLKEGANFEDLARQKSLDEISGPKGGDLGFLKWSEAPLQQAIFALKPGELSGVVKTIQGYHIIKAEERKKVNLPPLEEMENQLRNELAQPKQIRRRLALIKNLKEKAKLQFDDQLLNDLAKKTPPYVDKNLPPPPPALSPEDSSKIVLRFKGGEWTVAKVMKFLEAAAGSFIGGQPSFSDPQSIKHAVEKGIGPKLIELEAQNQHLDRLKKFQVLFEGYKESRVANQVLTVDVVNKVSVTKDEAEAYFKTHRNDYVQPEQVRVREILVTSQEEAERIKRELDKGADFAKMAEKNSIHWTRQKGGDLGLLPRGKIKEVDEVAFNLKVGEISQPFPTKDGFAIFKLEESKKSRLKTFEEVKEEIENFLKQGKQQQKKEELLSELKKQIKIEVFEDLLDQAGEIK